MYHQIYPKEHPNRTASWVAWLLLLSVCLGLFATPVLAAQNEISTTSQQDSATSTLPLSALVTFLAGDELSRTEAEWLDTQADTLTAHFTMTYDSLVPHENIILSLDNGTLAVSASTYVGGACDTVWTPTAVTYLDQTYPLTATSDPSVFATAIPCEQDVDMAEVSVAYEAKLALPDEDISTYGALLNAAYDAADQAMLEMASYEEAMADYTAQTEAYVAYQAALRAYKVDFALYQAYLQAKEDYETKLAAYETYQTQLTAYETAYQTYAAYLAEKAAYDEAYAAYMAFLADPSGYEQTYLAYVDYLNQVEMVNAQIAILDSFFVSDSKGNVMNATLNGPTVASVVQNKNELVAAGCNETDIINADKATANLISLLAGYSPKASTADKYAYYIKNYQAYKENVTLLYVSLSRLYENDGVPDLLQMQGKLERYWQFVAQLYVLTCSLDDTILLDKTWSISEGKLLLLLEACFLLPDKNQATPLSAYPTPVEEVVSPDEMTMPKAPTPVTKPVSPLPVAKPDVPMEVQKPTVPAVVKEPGDLPTKPEHTALMLALVEDVKQGSLKKRALTTIPEAYTLTQKVGKGVATKETPVAWFYDADRMTLLGAVCADAQDKVTLPQNIPDHPDTAGKRYVFDGYVSETGVAYTPDQTTVEITADTVFYATYQTKNIPYTITFLVEGEAQRSTYTYGETPIYDGIPQKDADADYAYAFAGWTPAVVPVTGDATYEAVFVPVADAYTVTWVIDGREETEVYSRGETPKYPHTPQKAPRGRYTYEFSGWTPAITPVYDRVTYTAVFKEVDMFPLMSDSAQVGLITTADYLYVSFGQNSWQDQAGVLVDVSRLAEYGANQDKNLMLMGQDLTVTLSVSDLKTISEAKGAWLQATYADDAWQWQILGADKQILPVSAQATCILTILQGYLGGMYDQNNTLVAQVQADTSQITVTATAGETYALYMGQNITLNTAERGFCVSDRPYATAGQTVTLTAMPQVGYGVAQLTVTTAAGETVACASAGKDTYTFVMPDQDVTVTPAFSPLTYTVVFKANGEILSTQTYTYGETPIPPSDPTKPSDQTNRYTFVGWDKTLTPVMADAVYEAVFVPTPLTDVSGVQDSGVGFAELCIMGVAAFVVTTGGVLVPYFVIRAKKKAKVEQGKGIE